MIFKTGNLENKNRLIFRFFISKIIEIFIISFLIFLLWKEMLSIEKLIKYLIIILFILIYLFIVYTIKLILIENWLEENKKKYNSEKGIIEKEKIIEKISNGFNKLLYVYIYINPVLSLFLYYFENQLYYFRWVNYKLRKFWILKYIHYYFIHSLYILVIYPIMLMFWFYYKIIKRWKEYSLTELLFRRTEGLILSILIFSDLYKGIYKYINEYNIYLIIYLVLIVIVQFILIYNKILFKKFEKYYQNFHIKFSINGIIKYQRNESIIIGELLKNIIELLKKEDKNRLNFSNYFNYNYDYTLLENFRKENLILFYIDENFLIEEKYKPSYNYYRKLVYIFNDIDTDHNWIYLKRLKKEENIKIYKEYYEYKLKCIKIKFFLIWSIEEYIGIENVYLEWFEVYNTNCSFYLELKNDNIEEYFNINKEEKFLDISGDKEILYNLLRECSMKTKKEYNYINNIKICDLERIDYQYETRELMEEYKKEYEKWYKNIRQEWEKKKEERGINNLIKELKKNL